MMFVCGYSGIGKTCVVQEIHKPIVGQGGYFIRGKFDQFKRDIPYAALIQAFQELIRQLLTQNSDKYRNLERATSRSFRRKWTDYYRRNSRSGTDYWQTA